MLNERSRKPPTAQRAKVGDSVAGWRLVRPLSSDYGEFLGVADFGSATTVQMSRHWAGFSTSEQPLLRHRRVVVAHGGEEAASLARECAIRDDVGSEFVELTEETVLDGDIRIAVFPMRHVRAWSGIVAANTRLSPSELVTSLVPIVETVQLAHSNGIVHGSLSLAACEIDESGRPRLGNWGSAVRLDGLPAVKADLARNSDLRALGRIADAMLALSPVRPPDHLRQLIDALCDGVTPKDATERLADALFQWAEPGPLPLSVLPGVSHSGADALPTAAAVGSLFENVDGDADSSEKDAPLLQPQRRTPFRYGWRRAKERLLPVTHWVGSVRPTIWAGLGAVGAITLVGGVALGIASGSPTRENPAADVAAGIPAHETQTESDDFTPAPSPASSLPEDAPVGFPATESESSLNAVPRLIASRNECIHERSAECLEDLYSPNAPGLLADLERTADPETADQSLVPQQEWVLAADLGDIELFSGDDGVSLAIARTPDGWLLRDMWFSAETLIR